MWKYLLASSLLLWLWMVSIYSIASSQQDLYSNLISKIGVVDKGNSDYQYANVSYCGKTVSVTVNHLALAILSAGLDTTLLAVDKQNDVAIFSRLSEIPSSPLATTSPKPFDTVYIPLYVWSIKVDVVYKYTVIGLSNYVAVAGIGFFGASGSGVYNENEEFVGSVSTLALAPNRDGQPMQIGIIGVTRLDVIKALMEEKVCKAP